MSCRSNKSICYWNRDRGNFSVLTGYLALKFMLVAFQLEEDCGFHSSLVWRRGMKGLANDIDNASFINRTHYM